MYANLNRGGQPDLTRIVKAPAGPDSSKLVAPALVVVAIFAIAGAIWWISALYKTKPQMSDSHVLGDEAPASSAAPTPADSAAGGPAPEGAPVSGDSSVPGGATAPGQGAAPAAPSSGGARVGSPTASGAGSSTASGAGAGPSRSATGTTSAPARPGAGASGARSATARSGAGSGSSGASGSTSSGATARSTGAATGQPTRTRTASAAAGTADAATAAAAAPRPKNQSSVTLRYSADSWTEVYDSTGSRLFYDVGAANSVQTVVGTPPLRVVLGNASGVAVEYNGHSKPIAKLSRPDGSVQFSITRSGEVVRAKPVADGG